MVAYLLISIVVSIAVALNTLGWFFRDGDDSTRSLQEFCERSVGPFSYHPWWATRFGLWLGVSIASGMLSFHLLPMAWTRLLSQL